MNDCITTTKQSTTKPCAYFLGYTVVRNKQFQVQLKSSGMTLKKFSIFGLFGHSQMRNHPSTMSQFIVTNGFYPKIVQPCRFIKKIGSIIDHTFCKSSESIFKSSSGILISNMSDHLSHFTCLDILSNQQKTTSDNPTQVQCGCRGGANHDGVIKWKHSPRYWPFVQVIHRWPVNSPHNGMWRGPLMFSLICAWTNRWVNNREAGHLRRYRALYDVIAMIIHSNQHCCKESFNVKLKYVLKAPWNSLI